MINPTNPTNAYTVPSVSITTARTGASSKANALGMRAMQERAYAKRGEQYLLIKSPPASGKSRALMFIALDKLHNQGLRQAIIVVPERSIGGSFADEPLSQSGFYWDWQVAPQWNLCNAPGVDDARVAKSKVKAVGEFLASSDKTLVCTHATFRFAVDELGVEAFDDRLIAIDEFHHVSSSPDNKLGSQLGAFIARDKAHLAAMTGSYFRGDSEAVLAITMDEKSLRQVQASIAAKKVNIPEDEARELARRALQFKHERGRLPDINSADPWEKRMAEGVAALARYRAQAKAAQGAPGNG